MTQSTSLNVETTILDNNLSLAPCPHLNHYNSLTVKTNPYLTLKWSFGICDRPKCSSQQYFWTICPRSPRRTLVSVHKSVYCVHVQVSQVAVRLGITMVSAGVWKDQLNWLNIPDFIWAAHEYNDPQYALTYEASGLNLVHWFNCFVTVAFSLIPRR